MSWHIRNEQTAAEDCPHVSNPRLPSDFTVSPVLEGLAHHSDPPKRLTNAFRPQGAGLPPIRERV